MRSDVQAERQELEILSMCWNILEKAAAVDTRERSSNTYSSGGWGGLGVSGAEPGHWIIFSKGFHSLGQGKKKQMFGSLQGRGFVRWLPQKMTWSRNEGHYQELTEERISVSYEGREDRKGWQTYRKMSGIKPQGRGGICGLGGTEA